MIETVPGYRVRCDGCNVDAQEDSEYACWLQEEGALATVEDSDWLITEDGGHYCPDCVGYDDDLDIYAPLPQEPRDAEKEAT